jgi:hypothetical protein
VIPVYTDENVDRRIIGGLRRRGVDVLTAQDAGLLGSLPDEQHLAFAAGQRRLLLTSDADLLAIAHAWNTAGRVHAGVVFYHQAWTSLGHVVTEVHNLVRAIEPEALANRVVFVTWNQRPTSK